jgi:multidrug resistance efflux pump
MTTIKRDAPEYKPVPEDLSTLQVVAALSQFEGTPDRFLAELLAAQCRLSGAEGGAVLGVDADNQLKILATHPATRIVDGGADWIAAASACFQDVITDGKTAVKPAPDQHESGDRTRRRVIVIPIQGGLSRHAVAAFAVRSKNTADLEVCLERLELTLFLLNLFEMRLTLRKRQMTLNRISVALETLAAVNKCRHFMEAAMALCNEIAPRWHCNRVSLGFLNGRYVQVQAMSNTEKFNPKMKLVQDLEAAMEECLDQDLEMIYPAPENAAYGSRAAEQFHRNHGPASLLSLPVRETNEVPAVIMLERPPESAFTPEEIESVRLTCDLCSTRLVELREHDRWFGARMAASARKGLEVLIGPRHTWLKVAAVSIFSLAVFLTFAKGEYRVEAPFIFEATVQQSVVTPFDTYIKSVAVISGDEVEAHKTILGMLENTELRLQLAALEAEKLRYKKQMAAAMRDRKTADAQIAQADADKAAAEIRLVKYKIERATLTAPISGRIVSEDLTQQIGAPVETGTVLFEIAPLDSLRAELYVPEDMIADVKENQGGTLAAVGYPDQKLKFVVERIKPVADVVNERNVFKVRALLLNQYEWMRPGMEGVAMISAGRKSYLWIGSRRPINWLRMKLWL